jgi:hypothetical protein
MIQKKKEKKEERGRRGREMGIYKFCKRITWMDGWMDGIFVHLRPPESDERGRTRDTGTMPTGQRIQPIYDG